MRIRYYTACITFFGCLLISSCTQKSTDNPDDWAWYQGDAGANQYSDLTQINKENVNNLTIAWQYHSGDADPDNRSQIQCNPLIINGILYATTPSLKLVALDAKTGSEIWRFDPYEGEGFRNFGMGVNRGLALWTDGEESRIMFAVGASLFAINAHTGQMFTNFGLAGRVDLHEGLGERSQDLFVSANTPGIVYKNLFILGVRVSEAMGAAPGHVQELLMSKW